MKTKFLIYISIIAFIIGFSSCLESGLDDLPTYEDAEVTAINFEYRWAIPENENDPWAGEKLQVKTLTTSAKLADGQIECSITVPKASGTFTEAERAKVTLSNLNVYVTISPGSTIKPNGNTPAFGKLGDYSQSNLSYQVIAANGKNKKEWKLTITSLSK